MDFKRADRVAGDIKNKLSRIILKEINDPFVGFITITNVVVSDDLKIAKIYFTALGDDAVKQKSHKGLIRAKGFLRKKLSTQIRLKNIPDLKFFLDDSWDTFPKIDEILNQ